MKDQNPINDTESKDVKWNRGLDLFIESVYRPDNELRQAAHDQRCFTELMEVREHVLEYLHTLRRYEWESEI